jgi:hypothetical protein
MEAAPVFNRVRVAFLNVEGVIFQNLMPGAGVGLAAIYGAR